MRLNEFNSMLFEDKVQFIAKQMDKKIMFAYKQDIGQKPELKTSEEVVRLLSTASKKAVQWLTNRYIAGEFKLEDVDMIKQELAQFTKIQSKLSPEQKDLNRLTLANVYDILDKYSDVDTTSNKELDRQEKANFFKNDAAELVYKDKELIVLIPKTEEASCYFGKGTKWCTAASEGHNYFDSYNNRGPLYIVMTKTMGKYQFQFESNSFMDARDLRIQRDEFNTLLSTYPKLYDIFEDLSIKGGSLLFVKNPTEEQQQTVVAKDPSKIKELKNPSEATQAIAVGKRAALIKDIGKPTLKIMMAAVQQDGTIIEYIKNPPREVQFAAVRNDGSALYNIDNPDEALTLAVVEQDGTNILWIDNPSEAVQMAAVKQNPVAFDFIDEPSPAVLALVNN